MKKYSDLLRQMRHEAGMTQSALSSYLEIPKRTLEDWERDKRVAPHYVMQLIAYKLQKENKIERIPEGLEHIVQ